MAELEVSALTRDRIDPATRMLSRAFDTSPPFRFLYPHHWMRERLTRTFFRAGIRDALPFGEVYAATDGSNVIGACVWLPRGSYPQTRVRQVRIVASCLPVAALAIRSTVPSLTYLAAAERVHPREPHWYLATLGVEPARQRSGIGSMLLAPVLRRLDDEGVPAYLETDKPENLAYYTRHGFELRDTLHPVAAGPPEWTMWRAPRGPVL